LTGKEHFGECGIMGAVLLFQKVFIQWMHMRGHVETSLAQSQRKTSTGVDVSINRKSNKKVLLLTPNLYIVC